MDTVPAQQRTDSTSSRTLRAHPWLITAFSAALLFAVASAQAAVEVTAQRGGVLEDAAAAGEYVYVGQGSTIVTLPSEPKDAVQASVTPPLPGLVESLAIDEDVLFVGWTDVADLPRIDLYSLADPGRPQHLGAFDHPFAGNFEPSSLAIVGDTLYLTTGGSLVPIDLSGPEPVLGTPATLYQSQSRIVPVGPDLLVSSGLSSIVGAPICQAVDVTAPLAPSVLGGFICGSILPIDQRFVVDLWVPGFEIWDLADPADPVQVASEWDLATRGGTVADRLLLVAESDSVRIWDLIHPSDPVEGMSIPAPLEETRLALTTPDLNRAAFLTDRAQMYTVDVSDPGSPQLEDPRELPVGTRPFELDTLGSDLLVADELLGLRVLDEKFSRLADIGDLGLEALCALDIEGSRALVADSTDVYLVDLQLPDAPVVLGSVPLADVSSVQLDGNRGWALSTEPSPVVYSLDLSDTSSLQTVHSWDVSDDLRLQHSGDRLYGVGGPTFWIFDVQTLFLVPIGVYQECSGRESRVEGTLAAIGCTGSEVHLVDVTTPSSPTRLGTYTLPVGRDARSLHFAGDVLYLGYDGGLDLVDVGDPSQPQLIQRLEIGGRVSDLVAAPGGGVWALAEDGGLAKIQEPGVVLAPQSLNKPSALR